MPMNCFFPHQKERKEKKEKEKMAGNIYRGGMVGGRVLGMMKGRGIMVGGVRNLELKKEEMCFSFSCFGLGRFSSSSTRIETKIIDGRAIANEILDEVKKEAEMLKKETGFFFFFFFFVALLFYFFSNKTKTDCFHFFFFFFFFF